MTRTSISVATFCLALFFSHTVRAADTCTIHYDVNASFAVSNTDFGKGNMTATGLGGSLVIEYTHDGKGRVVDGPANILHYATYVNFDDKSVVTVSTKVHYFTPSCNGIEEPKWRLSTDKGYPDACGYRGNRKPVATGTLDREKGTIEWGACRASSDYWSKSRKDYKLTSGSSGAGCLNALRAVGNVACDGKTACKLGHLSPGNNPQSNKWTQPLIHGPDGSSHSVAVSTDLSTVSTPLSEADHGELSYEIPNDAPSRTWISWKATKKAKSKFTTCQGGASGKKK